MAEQNTKPEWEKEFDKRFVHFPNDPIHAPHLTDSQAGVKNFIRDLLASQRHQLKAQVLEAVGKDKEIFYPNDGGTYFQVTPYVNEEKAEIRKRIEAVFDDKVVK